MLDCPLKRESAPVIAELLQSSHRVIMITGDSALTALSVARKVCVRGAPRTRARRTVIRRPRRS